MFYLWFCTVLSMVHFGWTIGVDQSAIDAHIKAVKIAWHKVMFCHTAAWSHSSKVYTTRMTSKNNLY